HRSPSSLPTLPLHDALPIFFPLVLPAIPLMTLAPPIVLGIALSGAVGIGWLAWSVICVAASLIWWTLIYRGFRQRVWYALLYPRSEEHTSELQSLRHLVCRL